MQQTGSYIILYYNTSYMAKWTIMIIQILSYYQRNKTHTLSDYLTTIQSTFGNLYKNAMLKAFHWSNQSTTIQVKPKTKARSGVQKIILWLYCIYYMILKRSRRWSWKSDWINDWYMQNKYRDGMIWTQDLTMNE